MEFVEVMKDWRRMCAAMSEKDEYTACDRCQLQDFGCPAIYETDEEANWAHVESVVAKWAAEHPVKQYPTWIEWLHDNGIILDARQHDEIEHWVLGLEAMKPIPADMAEKLGIEPKHS